MNRTQSKMIKMKPVFKFAVFLASLALVHPNDADAGIVSGLNSGNFTTATVEQFNGTYVTASSYDFGNGMVFQNLDGFSDHINRTSGYGMGQADSVTAGIDGSGDGYFGTLASPSSVQLTFAGGISAFGFYGAEAESSGTAADGLFEIQFYDLSDALIDMLAVSTTGTSAWNQFHGFATDAGAIGRVVFKDSGWMIMDNVSFQAIPEPATLAFVGIFGSGLWFVRRYFPRV